MLPNSADADGKTCDRLRKKHRVPSGRDLQVPDDNGQGLSRRAILLANLHAARPARPARAHVSGMDVGEGGRRLEGDGVDPKDELPAYSTPTAGYLPGYSVGDIELGRLEHDTQAP